MSNQYAQNKESYAMRSLSARNEDRDTYGLPYNNGNNHHYNYNDYDNNGSVDQHGSYYNPNYQNTNHGQYNQNGYVAPVNSNHYNNNTSHVQGSSNDPQPLQANKYYNGYDDNRASLAMMSNMDKNNNNVHQESNSANPPPDVSLIKPEKKPKSKYLPCFPCIRSTCGRVTCCICLLLFLVIIVLVIVVFTVFKVPTVDYTGLQGDPVFTFNQGNTTFGVNLVANIQVKNPNPIGFNFESIVATAYYPGYAPSIGGGNITHVNFPSKSTKTIQFPIMARYDRHQDPGFTVVQNILNKCGITGGTEGQITINYDLKVTIKIIGISISPAIKNQSTSFACPVNIGDIAKGIPGSIGDLIGGILG
ncbi:hypothetical protein BGX28_008654 [Mortierella sp. GBA30]|nr:hypothetical protein BGX28_008654 [Mortierella sp. GBA30]